MTNARVNRSLTKFVWIVMFVMVCVVVGGRVSQVNGARTQCERSSKGAKAVAPALRAQSNYFNSVLAASSVKQDVKDAAKKVQRTMNKSATILEDTNRGLKCRSEYTYLPHL